MLCDLKAIATRVAQITPDPHFPTSPSPFGEKNLGENGEMGIKTIPKLKWGWGWGWGDLPPSPFPHFPHYYSEMGMGMGGGTPIPISSFPPKY